MFAAEARGAMSALAAGMGLVLLCAGTASAQQRPPILAGAEIRIALKDGGKVRGFAVASPADSILLTDQHRQRRAFAASSIAVLETLQGRRSNIGRGAVLGVIAGAAAGWLWSTTQDDCYFSCADVGVALGASGGLLLGAAYGLAPKDVWRAHAPPWSVAAKP